MSVGDSGRIVIEVDPETKKELYALLHRNGDNMKRWFLRHAEDYVRQGTQIRLFERAPAEIARGENS